MKNISAGIIIIICIVLTACSAMDIENLNEYETEPTVIPTTDISTPKIEITPSLVIAAPTEILSQTPKPTIVFDESKAFLPLETSLYGIDLGTDIKDIEEIYGQPINVEKGSTPEPNGGYFIIYHYELFVLDLYPSFENGIENHSVIGIEVLDPNYKGPRNLAVGDTAETVLEKFQYPEGLLYVDNTKSFELYHDMDKYGYIIYDDIMNIKRIDLAFEGQSNYFVVFFADGIVRSYVIGVNIN